MNIIGTYIKEKGRIFMLCYITNGFCHNSISNVFIFP